MYDRKAGTQVTELLSLSHAPGKSRPCTSLVRAASTQIDCLIRGRLQKGEQGFAVPACSTSSYNRLNGCGAGELGAGDCSLQSVTGQTPKTIFKKLK